MNNEQWDSERMNDEQVIGVVAGVGPLAGLDLLGKIVAQTAATSDQEHLPVLSISWPSRIPDRTAFLLGRTADNPAYPLVEQLALLARMGATVAAIPCNTVHAPAIFQVIVAEVARWSRPLKLLHMIAEVAAYLQANLPGGRAVGVLATTGTITVQLYPQVLEPAGFRVLVPSPVVQETAVHAAIYDPERGIKAVGRAAIWAKEKLLLGVDDLRRQGAQAIILGCTELPLVLPEAAVGDIPLVDPALILARALIREVNPARLTVFAP
jgi:aspartate racemase